MQGSAALLEMLCLFAFCLAAGWLILKRRLRQEEDVPVEKTGCTEEQTARATAAAAAVRAMDEFRVEVERSDIDHILKITGRLIRIYRHRLAGRSFNIVGPPDEGRLGHALRAVATEAERITIEDLLAVQAIRPEIARKLIGEIEGGRRSAR